MSAGILLGNIQNSIANIVPVLLKPLRSLNGIQADAVVEEHHEDTLVVTEHPVEQGAVIADHAYKMPAELVLTYVWSMGSDQNITFDPSFLRSLYQQLLQLQIDRTLFDVLTGKRSYTNMLLTSLSLTTDKYTENILSIRITCREILQATTQVLQLTSSAVQSLPQKTAPIINQGPVNLGPAPNFNSTGVQ